MNATALSELVTGFVSLLYPPHCALCRAPLAGPAGLDWRNQSRGASELSEPLCPRCREALPVTRPPWCPGCARSLAGTGADVTHCRDCRRRPSGFAWARAACAYEGVAKECVVQLKYHRQLGLVGPMARQMLAAARTLPPVAAEALVPVPLHAARQRERTFNQAGVLAESLGAALGLPVLAHALLRRRATAPQHTLEAPARRANVAGCFAIRQPALVRGRSLLLVDDVVTTGATAQACARALRAAGATRLGLLAFAHG